MALSDPKYSVEELTRTKGEMEAFLADEAKLAKARALLEQISGSDGDDDAVPAEALAEDDAVPAEVLAEGAELALVPIDVVAPAAAADLALVPRAAAARPRWNAGLIGHVPGRSQRDAFHHVALCSAMRVTKKTKKKTNQSLGDEVRLVIGLEGESGPPAKD